MRDPLVIFDFLFQPYIALSARGRSWILPRKDIIWIRSRSSRHWMTQWGTATEKRIAVPNLWDSEVCGYVLKWFVCSMMMIIIVTIIKTKQTSIILTLWLQHLIGLYFFVWLSFSVTIDFWWWWCWLLCLVLQVLWRTIPFTILIYKCAPDLFMIRRCGPGGHWLHPRARAFCCCCL